jgi:ADP-ribose 1''-phosphate phosphatase
VGIALAFRERYPAEFRVYRAHCAQSTPDELLGTALLVPTQPAGALGRGHYIGFLFTSRGSGMGRPDSPSDILRATGPAMKHLMRLIAEEEKKPGASAINELRMCRINTGLFAVPWPLTKAAIQALVLGEGEVPGIAKEGILEVVAYEKA